MDWNTIYNLIDARLMIVIALCWVIGYILKRTPRFPDWCIVYVVTFAAVLLTIWLLGFGPESIIQGVLAGAFAVYGNQLVKQARKKGDQDKSLWL